MKKTFFSILSLGIIVFNSCNNSNTKTESEGHDMNKDTIQHAGTPDDKEVKIVAVTYPSIDAKAAASIKEIVDYYLQIKNALANDNGNEAAKGGKAMEEVMSKLDKSLFTSEQKKTYDQIEEDLKEDAEHIGKNGDKIKHQREHFSTMSADVYYLIKAFGAGKPIYHDHCPMYDEGKGAMWLSEMKEIKNPYYGAKCPLVVQLKKLLNRN